MSMDEECVCCVFLLLVRKESISTSTISSSWLNHDENNTGTLGSIMVCQGIGMTVGNHPN